LSAGTITNTSSNTNGTTNGDIDFKNNSTGVLSASSITSSGAAGGDILGGVGSLVVSGSITNSRTAAGADIIFGSGAGVGSTVSVSGTVSNQGLSIISFAFTADGLVSIGGNLQNTSTGSITFPNITTANISAGILNITAGTITVPTTHTGDVTVQTFTITGGTLNIQGSAGTADFFVTSSASMTAGTMNFNGLFQLRLSGTSMTIGGPNTNPTFTNATTTQMNFDQPIPNVLQTITVGNQIPTYPGPFNVINPAALATVVRITGGALRITNDVTFNSGLVLNAVQLDGGKILIGANDPGGSVGNFINTTGFAAINDGRVVMSGNGAQTVTVGTGAVAGGFEVDNNGAASPAVTFAGVTPAVMSGFFYLTEGVVDGANCAFNGPSPFPTIVRNDGTFNAAPTFTSLTNVAYIGLDKVTSVEIPNFGIADKLNNLTIATTNSLVVPGRGVVSLSTAAKVNGILTVNLGQTLYQNGFNLTVAGPSVAVLGDIACAVGGPEFLQLASPTGSVFSGSGFLPDIKVMNGSVGNVIAGPVALVDGLLGGDAIRGNGNDDTTPDGSIVYDATAPAGASALTLTFPGAGPHLNNITTSETTDNLILGANLNQAGNLTHGGGVINVGTFIYRHRGTTPSITGPGATITGTSGTFNFPSVGSNYTLSVLTAAATISANVQFSMTGNTFTFSGNNLTLAGNVLDSTGTIVLPAGLTLFLTGSNVTVLSGGGFTGTGVLALNATTPPMIFSASGISISNLSVLNSVTMQTGGITVTSNFVHTGGLFDFGGQTVTLSGTCVFSRTGGTYAGTGFLVWNSTGTFTHGPAMQINNFRVSSALNLVSATNFTVVNTLHLNNATFNHYIVASSAGFLHIGLAGGAKPLVEVTGGAGDILSTGAPSAVPAAYDQGTVDFVFDGASFAISVRVWPPALTGLAQNVTVGVTGGVSFIQSRTINGPNLTLNSGTFSWDSVTTLTLASGILITRNDAGALLGTSGGLIAPLVNLAYNGAIGNTGREYSGPTTIGTMSISGSLNIASSRTVTAAVSLVGTLNVNAATTFSGTFSFPSSTLNLNANTTFTQALTVPGPLVTSTMNIATGITGTFQGTLAVAGNTNVWGTAAVTGAMTVSGTYFGDTTGVLNAAGSVTVSGNMNLAKKFSANAGVTVGGTFAISGNLNLPGGATDQVAINCNGNLTVTGGWNYAAPGNATADLTAGLAAVQAFTFNGATSLRTLNISKTADVTVTATGGDLTIVLNLGLNRGILVIADPFSAILTLTRNAQGIITSMGFTRSPSLTLPPRHCVGKIGVAIPAGTIGRTEWPLGSPGGGASGRPRYRPAAITFTADHFIIVTTTIFVGSVDAPPLGTVNLPISDGCGVTIGAPSPYYWLVSATTSPGQNQLLDLEFTGDTTLPTSQRDNYRIIRRFDGNVQTNGWFLQGSCTNYSNIVFQSGPLTIDTSITVRNINSPGGVISQASRFAIGIPTTGFTVAGNVLYRNANFPNSGVTGTTVNLNPGFTTTSGANGGYSFSPVPAGNYTLTASRSGNWLGVNSTDALLVARFFVGLTPFDTLQKLAGDVNGDGVVNALDAQLIIRRVAGLVPSYTRDWSFLGKSFTVNADRRDTILALCAGDVNGSNLTPPSAPPKIAVNSVTMNSNGTQKAAQSKAFDVPIRVSSAMNLGAVTLRLKYPIDMATFVGISTSALSGSLSNHNAEEGTISLAWFDATGGTQPVRLKENDVLVTLRFTSKTAKGTFNVSLEPGCEFADAQGNVIEGSKVAAPVTKIAEIPTVFALDQNYPNPFNPSTHISYGLPLDSKVSLTVYNIVGQQVATLVNDVQEAGVYTAEWNAGNLASGVYIYRLSVQAGSESFTMSKRLVLLK
jgi:hypothetical protein